MPLTSRLLLQVDPGVRRRGRSYFLSRAVQAIDRTHRIGQARRVFAYRLIARDTVEEKVLELQQTKRDLAGNSLTADNSLIRDLRTEDLELLLS